jgi:hypothetical protein
VVEEATRASDSNVDPGAQLLYLRLHAHTTVEGDLAQRCVLSQGSGDMDLSPSSRVGATIKARTRPPGPA